jgi:hypothetical protein
MDEAPRGSDEVDLNKSLQEVLKSAARNDGLARGLRGKNLSIFMFSQSILFTL